jgi:hypothetical protein
MEQSSLEVRLNRLDRVYRPNEKVEGVVVVNAYKGWSHSGVHLDIEGFIFLSHNNRGVIGGIRDMANRPTNILKQTLTIAPSGKFPDGPNEVPFEFPLTPVKDQTLHESYHGLFISVVYIIQVTCDRGVLKKGLSKDIEFLVELPGQGDTKDPEAKSFSITPESLGGLNAKQLAAIPKFSIAGKVHRTRCPINQPFTGEVIVEMAQAPVKAMELQLVRVETVTMEGRTTKESTEIQTIQIGDGNVCRNLSVPMYMVYPRLFSCPTVVAKTFSVEFEVNIIVVYGDGYTLTENFPLVLYREKSDK